MAARAPAQPAKAKLSIWQRAHALPSEDGRARQGSTVSSLGSSERGSCPRSKRNLSITAASPSIRSCLKTPSKLAVIRLGARFRRVKQLHTKARSEINEAYLGKRIKGGVPDKYVPWATEWALYSPMQWTAEKVTSNCRDLTTGAKWADPDDPKPMRKELEERITYCISADGEPLKLGAGIRFDPETGAPLNPEGRTGLAGRGLLGAWGPNHAADPIVTRHEPLTGSLQVLCILRNDTGEWALPGGIVKPGESVSMTVRKSIEECGKGFEAGQGSVIGKVARGSIIGRGTSALQKQQFDKLVDDLFSHGSLVFMGYSDDPRNTDNAWMESKVVHFHCSALLGAMLPLKAATGKGVKAGAVVWLDADAEIEPRYASLYGSHMQWVDQATRELRNATTEDSDINISGMNAEARIFQSTEHGVGDVEVAKLNCLRQRCIVKVPNADGEHVDSAGVPYDIKTFPFWAEKYDEISKYGCSVAQVLHLRFHLEAAVLLLLMLAVSLFPLAENASRNNARNSCRTRLAEEYDALTAPGSNSSCGFGGYPMIGSDGSVTARGIPFFLLAGLGTCQEYANQTERPAFFGEFSGAEVATFVEVPAATFCKGVWFGSSRIVSYWFEVVSTALLLFFLVRERSVIARTSEEDDVNQLTCADYAVMITGLARNQSPDDVGGQPGLETRLRDDLKALGFHAEDIDHIEIGRECAREAECLRRLASLRIERQELQARRKRTDICNRSKSAEESPVEYHGLDTVTLQPGADVEAGWRNLSPSSCRPEQTEFGTSATLSCFRPKRLAHACSSEETGTSDSLVGVRSCSPGSRPVPPTLGRVDSPAVPKDRRSDSLSTSTSSQQQTRSLMARLKDGLHVPTGRSLHFRPPSAADSRESAEARKSSNTVSSAWLDFRKGRQRKREHRIEKQLRASEAKLSALLQEAHRSTGHAFVVFKYEEKRIALVKWFYRPSRLERWSSTLFMRKAQERGTGALPSSAAPDREVVIGPAAEPSEVCWENLAVSRTRHLAIRAANFLVMLLILVGSLLLLTTVSTWKAAIGTVDETNSVPVVRTLALSVFAAWISVFTNFLITHITTFMAGLEKHATRTRFERAIFSKLAPAFVVNTAVAPLLVGCVEALRTKHLKYNDISLALCGEHCGADADDALRYLDGGSSRSLSDNSLIYQWWYESGGILQHVIITILASASTDLIHLVQPVTLFKRHVLAPLATSQHKLNKLYEPPTMHVGRLYAYSLRTISMAIIYAPLNPVVLPLCALMLTVTFWATRYAVAFWYERPPAMSFFVMERLRVLIGWVVLLQLVVKRLAYGDPDAAYPFYVTCVLWSIYTVTDIVRKGLQPPASMDLDTDGVGFDEANIEERYVCPKARRGTASQSALKAHLMKMRRASSLFNEKEAGAFKSVRNSVRQSIRDSKAGRGGSALASTARPLANASSGSCPNGSNDPCSNGSHAPLATSGKPSSIEERLNGQRQGSGAQPVHPNALGGIARPLSVREFLQGSSKNLCASCSSVGPRIHNGPQAPAPEAKPMLQHEENDVSARSGPSPAGGPLVSPSLRSATPTLQSQSSVQSFYNKSKGSCLADVAREFTPGGDERSNSQHREHRQRRRRNGDGKSSGRRRHGSEPRAPTRAHSGERGDGERRHRQRSSPDARGHRRRKKNLESDSSGVV